MATSCLPAFAAEDSASLMIATFQHRLEHSMPSGSPSEACLESCFAARYLQSWGFCRRRTCSRSGAFTMSQHARSDNCKAWQVGVWT